MSTHYHDDGGNNARLEMIEKASLALSEHFDSVIIIATGATEDGTGATTLFKSQKGHVHAHEGAVREWLREQEGYQMGYFMERGRRDARRDNDV